MAVRVVPEPCKGILANEVPGDPLTTFRNGLVLIISLLAAAGLVAAGLLTRRPSVPLPAAEPNRDRAVAEQPAGRTGSGGLGSMGDSQLSRA